MLKKKALSLSLDATRDFTLTLEPVSGGITLFYAFVNGVKVIQADGTNKRIWSGTISIAQVRIKVRVVGIGNASFNLGIDLPGTAEDQSLTLKLQDGYYETDILL
ncbi:hypothetical protein MUK70_23480 [Dyadobacter chenwenxiniae]|uniref:Uncharacterized protein n=1 Tax=Dyadobacter chenwenxiniae TaxID=2906456 RepID=A0A9X1PK12_9BACT|nr:hypothetical protein [Dyadobacter chenwenxiniae]MCF0062206.1 hypothetical protein [Dyadobacter chenwenxiniae]UON82007.1 hypothetical protein MUK70_23480 [Dyadobacter chenwenxiniae]